MAPYAPLSPTFRVVELKAQELLRLAHRVSDLAMEVDSLWAAAARQASAYNNRKPPEKYHHVVATAKTPTLPPIGGRDAEQGAAAVESTTFDAVIAKYEGDDLVTVRDGADSDAGLRTRQSGAATTIGAGARGWQQRKRQRQQQAARAAAATASTSSSLALKRETDTAATAIGAAARGRLERRRLKQQQDAAQTIGRVARGRQQRKRYTSARVS